MAQRRFHEVLYTEHAARERDRLSATHRASLDKAVEMLARDPYPDVSRLIGVGVRDREVRLTSEIVAEYAVSRGRLVLVTLRVYDDRDILLP